MRHLHRILFLLVLLAPPLVAQQFSYPDFTSPTGLSFTGEAASVGNLVRLAPTIPGAAGAMWYSQPVPVRDGFRTTFTTRIWNLAGGGADGIAFVFHSSPDTTAALGGTGGDIGYAGIERSLAIEFDTHTNPEFADANDHHISVQTRGTAANSSHHQYSLGETSVMPRLEDGFVHTITISWCAGVLAVHVDDSLRPALTVPVDLAPYLDAAGRCYIGLTAATGGAQATHDILSWSYRATPGLHIDYAREVCLGDPAVFSASTTVPGTTWLWEFGDGATSRLASVAHVYAQPGTWRVVVRDSARCTAGPDTLTVIVHAPPLPVITRSGDTLRATAARLYEWRLNDTLLAAATTREIPIRAAGRYRVSVIDSNGCRGMSEEFIVRASATVALRCPPAEATAPGTTITVLLDLTESFALTDADTLEYYVRLRFNPSVLAPQLPPFADASVGRERFYTVRGTHLLAIRDAPLAGIPLTVTLGDAACTALAIDSVWFAGGIDAVAATDTCRICVRICEEGGPRLVDASAVVALRAAVPNPFNTTTRITFALLEEGPVELVVVDGLGRRVAALAGGSLAPGTHERIFDAANLSSGMYHIMLRTPSHLLTRPLHLLK
jgi:hypothetical protein